MKERLAFLDVARGAAAMLVLVEHGLNACFPDLLCNWVGPGYLGRSGVILFLLISGFIIPASVEQARSNGRFWLRRFFRLFPAYWLCIGLAFVYSCYRGPNFLESPSLSTGEWLLNLTMGQRFFGSPNVLGVFWTLQLELVIYATCSFWFATGLLQRSGWVACLLLLGYALIGIYRPLIHGNPFEIGGHRYLYFAPLTGLITQRYLAGRYNGCAVFAWVFAQIGVLIAIWTLNHLLFPAKITPDCLREFLGTWGIAYTCFFGLVAVRKRPMPTFACQLGRISYSQYLLHPLVLTVMLGTGAPIWMLLTGFFAGSILLAGVAYSYVEVPGIALGRALEKRWFSAKAQASLTPARAAA